MLFVSLGRGRLDFGFFLVFSEDFSAWATKRGWRCCSVVISNMWHVGNGFKMYQLWIDRVCMTANGFKPRQLKDDILDVCVTSKCRVVRLDARLHFSSAKILPRRVRPSIIVALHPAQRASSVADRICSVSRISCLQTGSNWERGETKSGLFLFPIVKGRIPSHDVARAFHLLATDRGVWADSHAGRPWCNR